MVGRVRVGGRGAGPLRVASADDHLCEPAAAFPDEPRARAGRKRNGKTKKELHFEIEEMAHVLANISTTMTDVVARIDLCAINAFLSDAISDLTIREHDGISMKQSLAPPGKLLHQSSEMTIGAPTRLLFHATQ